MGKKSPTTRFSGDFIKRCRGKAYKYDDLLSGYLNNMLTFISTKKDNPGGELEEIIASDEKFCSLMLKMMHDDQIPKFVVAFYEELYNSIRSIIDKGKYEEIKYFKEYLK